MEEILLVQRTSDAAAPQLRAALYFIRQLAEQDDVAHREASAGLQHPERLREHLALVAGQVDHAVADDHVDGVRRQRDGLDVSLEEFDVRRARFRFVLHRERQHFVRHVQAICFAARPDASRRQQHVDATARAEVQHRFAFTQLGERRRVAAAERRKKGFGWEAGRLASLVEIRGDGIPALGSAATAAARRGAAARDRRCLPPTRDLLSDGAIARLHGIADFLERRH